MKNKYLFVLLMLLSIALVAFGSTFLYVKLNTENKELEDFNIVTSCNPIYMATLNVVGQAEGVSVTNLSQPTTGCLHDYTLTTADMKVLSTADVLVINGLGMEGFLEDVIKAYPSLTIIDSSDGIATDYLIEGEEHHHDHDAEDIDDAEDHHDHEGEEHYNSHTWMSVNCYMAQVNEIAAELSKLDEAHAKRYEDNAMNYVLKLESELISQQESMIAKLYGRPACVLHEAYAYLAEGIGMEVVCDMDLDEERQVSAAEVAELIEELGEHQVGVVLAEQEYGSKYATVIEESSEAKVIYINNMIRGEFGADSYIEIMKENYDAIASVID